MSKLRAVVISPKGRRAASPGSAHWQVSFAAFNPTFKIRGTSVVLHPLEIVSIPLDQLGEKIGSLIDGSELIIAALDELLTPPWKQLQDFQGPSGL